ncbi:hypothetical protein T09_15842 [Trichinella sp. T9]|nr:hypothetical protein T09_15842 [Trichinella sp. T9]
MDCTNAIHKNRAKHALEKLYLEISINNSKVNSQFEFKARSKISASFDIVSFVLVNRMSVLANEDVHMQVSIKLDQCLSCQRALAFDQHYTLVL